jgi:hypothetical protein
MSTAPWPYSLPPEPGEPFILGYEPQHWLDVEWLCKVCHDAEHRGPTQTEVVQWKNQ